MKIGSLVRWANPAAPGFGIVVGEYENLSALDVLNGHILVKWFDGVGSGVIPKNHKYLELISETRRSSQVV